MVVIIDTGIPVTIVWSILNSREKPAELLKRKFIEDFINVLRDIKELNILVGFSVLDPEHEFDYLEEIRDNYLGSVEVLPILQLNAGLHSIQTDLQQIDTEGDVIGSLCPSRGAGFISALAKRSVEKFGSFSIDITDMFYFGTRGITSCFCLNCINELKTLLNNDESVIEFVLRGGLKDIVSSETDRSYTIMPIDKLMRNEEAGDISKKQLKNKIKYSYQFFQARSKLVGKLVVESFKDVNGYKAIFLEGSSMEAATSVITEVFLDYIDNFGKNVDIDIYVSKDYTAPRDSAKRIGIYNILRGRYLVNQFSFTLYHYYKLLSATSKYLNKENYIIINLYSELERRIANLMSVAERSWRPNLKNLKGLSRNYAIYGLKPIIEFTNDLMGRITFLVDKAERNEVLSSFDIKFFT